LCSKGDEEEFCSLFGLSYEDEREDRGTYKTHTHLHANLRE